MEPIISPWLLYWISISENIKMAFEFSIPMFIFGGGFIYCAVKLCVADCVYHNIKQEWPRIFKIAIILAIVLAIILVINIFIPTEETLYGMLALKYITPDNIDLGVDTIKSIVEYVMETAANYSARIGG